ncbi:MAG: Fur family transcriptional regulator [Candidatus Jordarchaeaceae archaeon]
MTQFSSEIISRLRRRGYKVTPQRLEIYKAVKSSEGHPTADNIYQEVKKRNPTISAATVYKTMGILEKMGEVQRIGKVNGKMVYDKNTIVHVNFHCINCGRVEDIESNLIEKLIKEVQNKTKSKIISQSINLYACCSKCQKVKQSP